MERISTARIRPAGWSLLALFLAAMLAEPAQAQDRPELSSSLNFSNAKTEVEGDGYMVGGEFWTTIKPMNTNESNHLEDPLANQGFVHWLQFGPDGTEWEEPPNMWPSSERTVNSWRDGHRMGFPVFEADGWPGYGPDNVIRANGGDATEDDRFMFAYYSPNLQGADDSYKRSARFTDRSRTHLVYEAGFPTTAGLDFAIRAHQYTGNEQNLNDFVTLEITVTNTGVVDTNGDGTPEATGHTIDALGALILTLPTIAVEIGNGGTRSSSQGGNRFGALRTMGYVASPDATGAPYNLTAWYANVPEGQFTGQAPPEGSRLFGFNDTRQLDGYTDVWNAWSWLGVKQGSYEDGLTAQSPDKQTIFGTHSVGEGERRGWYTSQHFRPELISEGFERSDFVFHSATATWYEDYGVTATPNFAPNSNFFSGGTADDVTTFTVGDPSARPNGDYKYASEDLSPDQAFENPVWEDAWNPQASNGDFFNGTGFNRHYTFGNRCFSAVGPFGLEVGESITMVLTLSGGYRLEGVADATEASRWAWEQGWDNVSSSLPIPPAPDMQVESTGRQSALISWTDVSSIDPEVDGYKIWRASQYKRTPYIDEGMRLLDKYQHQHTVGEVSDSSTILDPVNRYLGYENDYTEDQISGFIYQPAGWGTYDLVAKIPAGELEEADGGSFDYTFEDEEAITGFTYWYYVSAYKEGSFTGPQGPVDAGHIESSNLNRNGRNSADAPPGTIGLENLWNVTYPFAFLSPGFPEEGSTRYQNMGAGFTLTPPVAEVDSVAQNITVTPNPYKRTGLNDVRSNASSHNIYFLNTPENFTMTIVDVSGQIVFQEEVEGAVDGQFVWDMFSKDGVEVASGLYIYHIEYGDGRAKTGHLAILR